MITYDINLDSNMHLSTQNPKSLPTIGWITCKYLYKSIWLPVMHNSYMITSQLSNLQQPVNNYSECILYKII